MNSTKIPLISELEQALRVLKFSSISDLSGIASLMKKTPKDTIRWAYGKLAREVHPDLEKRIETADTEKMQKLSASYRLLLTHIGVLEDEIKKLKENPNASTQSSKKKNKFVDEDDDWHSSGVRTWKEEPNNYGHQNHWSTFSTYTFDLSDQNYINALKKVGTVSRITKIDGVNVFKRQVMMEQIQDVVDEKILEITGGDPGKLLKGVESASLQPTSTSSTSSTVTSTQLIDPNQNHSTAIIQQSVSMTIECFSYHSNSAANVFPKIRGPLIEHIQEKLTEEQCFDVISNYKTMKSDFGTSVWHRYHDVSVFHMGEVRLRPMNEGQSILLVDYLSEEYEVTGTMSFPEHQIILFQINLYNDQHFNCWIRWGEITEYEKMKNFSFDIDEGFVMQPGITERGHLPQGRIEKKIKHIPDHCIQVKMFANDVELSMQNLNKKTIALQSKDGHLIATWVVENQLVSESYPEKIIKNYGEDVVFPEVGKASKEVKLVGHIKKFYGNSIRKILQDCFQKWKANHYEGDVLPDEKNGFFPCKSEEILTHNQEMWKACFRNDKAKSCLRGLEYDFDEENRPSRIITFIDAYCDILGEEKHKFKYRESMMHGEKPYKVRVYDDEEDSDEEIFSLKSSSSAQKKKDIPKPNQDVFLRNTALIELMIALCKKLSKNPLNLMFQVTEKKISINSTYLRKLKKCLKKVYGVDRLPEDLTLTYENAHQAALRITHNQDEVFLIKDIPFILIQAKDSVTAVTVLAGFPFYDLRDVWLPFVEAKQAENIENSLITPSIALYTIKKHFPEELMSHAMDLLRFGNFKALCLSILIGGKYWTMGEGLSLAQCVKNIFPDELERLSNQYSREIQFILEFDMSTKPHMHLHDVSNSNEIREINIWLSLYGSTAKNHGKNISVFDVPQLTYHRKKTASISTSTITPVTNSATSLSSQSSVLIDEDSDFILVESNPSHSSNSSFVANHSSSNVVNTSPSIVSVSLLNSSANMNDVAEAEGFEVIEKNSSTKLLSVIQKEITRILNTNKKSSKSTPISSVASASTSMTSNSSSDQSTDDSMMDEFQFVASSADSKKPVSFTSKETLLMDLKVYLERNIEKYSDPTFNGFVFRLAHSICAITRNRMKATSLKNFESAYPNAKRIKPLYIHAVILDAVKNPNSAEGWIGTLYRDFQSKNISSITKTVNKF